MRPIVVFPAETPRLMKYLALIYGDESAWAGLSEEEQQAVHAKYRDFAASAGGKLVGGAETAASNTRDDRPRP